MVRQRPTANPSPTELVSNGWRLQLCPDNPHRRTRTPWSFRHGSQFEPWIGGRLAFHAGVAAAKTALMAAWRVTLPGQLLLIFVLAVAVYFDARRFGRRHGWERGFPSLGPISSAVFVLGFCVIATPRYVIRRVRLTCAPRVREAAVKERRQQATFRAQRESQFRSRISSRG